VDFNKTVAVWSTLLVPEAKSMANFVRYGAVLLESGQRTLEVFKRECSKPTD
jgi:hypothetical protein